MVMCMINVYCMQQLVDASHYLCKKFNKTSIDYANVARYATMVGPGKLRRHTRMAKLFVNCVLFTGQFSSCCVYFLFMAQNTKQVADYLWPDYKFNQHVWIAIFLLPEILLSSIRTLKALAPISLVANICYIAGCLTVFVYLLHGHQRSTELPAFADINKLPLAFGTIMFAFEGVPLVLPIENRCYDAKFFIHPLGVLNTSCYVVICIYCAVGYFGFLKKGDLVMDTITMDLPLTPWYNIAAKISFVVAMSGTYALMFYVPLERMELYAKKHWLENKGKWTRQLYYGMMRLFMILVTFTIAELVPHLDLFMSLVGSFDCSFLTLIIPSCINLLIIYDKGKIRTHSVIAPCLVILLGMLGFIIGTYFAVHDIVLELITD